MVELGKSTPTEDLFSAVDRLLENGAAGAKIAEMVAERIAAHPTVETATDIVDYLDHAEEDACEVIYEPGCLPDGLIDLPSASRSPEDGGYGIPIGTLRTWVTRNRVPKVGLLRAPAPRGGYIVVRRCDLETYKDGHKPTGGRPRKITA